MVFCNSTQRLNVYNIVNTNCKKHLFHNITIKYYAHLTKKGIHEFMLTVLSCSLLNTLRDTCSTMLAVLCLYSIQVCSTACSTLLILHSTLLVLCSTLHSIQYFEGYLYYSASTTFSTLLSPL